MANCQECPLFNEHTKYVPSLLRSTPKLTVVGEAPAFYEVTYGQPFKGPAGKLLDRVLKHYGYDRKEVSYTYVVSCRPEDNATPPKAAINACRKRLHHELSLSPGTGDLLVLGGTATQALVDSGRTISTIRVGPPKAPIGPVQAMGYNRVVASWHPSYTLRNADAFPTLVSDIGKLKEGANLVWTPPDWVSTDDPDDALRLIDEIRRSTDRVVVDIEVGIEKDTAYDHPNEYDLLCVGLAYARGKAVVIGSGALADGRVVDALRSLLRAVKIIAHNGKFDLAGLYPVFGALKLWFDTMLANYCLDERPGQHGLKVLAVETLGAPKYDDEIRQFVPRGGNYADIPRPILYKYNAYDVACTWDLYEILAPRLDADNPWPYPDLPCKTLRDVHDFLVAAASELLYLELNGITLDRVYSRQLKVEFTERLDTIENDLDRIISKDQFAVTTGKDGQEVRTWVNHINPRSPKQILAYFRTHRINVEKTEVETLKGLLSIVKPGTEVSEFLRTLLLHRKQAKLYSTYVEGIRKRAYRGRIFTTYTLHGTTSGRLASRNPNLQNIVRDKSIRRQFVAKDGHVLIQCDYKQAEGRVIATLAQDEYLRDIFSNPEVDIFDSLANTLYGANNWGKEERIRVKAFFYGLSYGRETQSIASEYNIPFHEALELRTNFTDLIPATVAWQADIKRRVLSGEDLVSPFGRRRRFWLITKQNERDVINEALSFVPQSTASDICLSALTTLRPMLRGLAFIRLTIHDALVSECKEKDIDEVRQMMQFVMEEKGRLFTDYVPFTTDATIGQNWGAL
jgi:uracil-DNA glycosylase family 4